MSFVGKWKMHSIAAMGEDGFNYITPAEYLVSPMDYVDESDEEAVADEMRERNQMVNTCIKIGEDGKMYMLMPLPEGVSQEEVDAAVAAGEVTLIDGMMSDGTSFPWEERDGEFYYYVGEGAEMYGDAVDGWIKPIGEDGLLKIITMRFEKAE